MSEYWVSQAKFHCKICNCWIADNKPSRLHHDNGAKHKEKLAEFLKKKRDDRLHGARSEQDLKQQLKDIEQAAQDAISADRVESNGNFFSYRSNFAAPPPPPPPLLTQQQQEQRSSRRRDGTGEGGEVEEEEDTGVYTVQGQTYLEGKKHEDKLRTGSACELFVEDDDEWYPGVITRRIETAIPNTQLVMLSFDIKYTTQRDSTKDNDKEDTAAVVAAAKTNNADVAEEKDVKSDRIRLLATAEGDVQQTLEEQEAVAVIDENTGVGAWQTVSVRREVDFDEEEQKSRLEIEAMLTDGGKFSSYAGFGVKRQHQQQQQNNSSSSSMERIGDDSALAAFDPYGKNKKIYKGFSLQHNATATVLIESVAEGATVAFRKRKAPELPIKTATATTTGGEPADDSNGIANSSLIATASLLDSAEIKQQSSDMDAGNIALKARKIGGGGSAKRNVRKRLSDD